jgi:hypothetical protein
MAVGMKDSDKIASRRPKIAPEGGSDGKWLRYFKLENLESRNLGTGKIERR